MILDIYELMMKRFYKWASEYISVVGKDIEEYAPYVVIGFLV